MHILIATGIFPPDIGGPATYVPRIAEALAGRGHQITVVTLSDRLEHDDTRYPFRVVRLPRRAFKPWRWLRTVLKFIGLGRDADLWFVNGLAMEAAVANLALRKPMVQKVVGDLAWERATTRGWVRDNFEEFQRKRYGVKVEALRALRAWWTRQAYKVIVPSRYLARWVAQWGVPEERIVLVYNALEPVDGIQAAELPLQTPRKVVTVGRLVPWKHVDQVMKAIGQINAAGLVIIGDGPERGPLEELARVLDISDRVYFAGQRSREETFCLMAACDLFVLNSTYEGLPHVVLEAMSLGLPVVATAVGGTPEVIENEENGRLVPPSDDRALVEGLSGLLFAPSERERLAEGARRTVERFGLARMVEETEALLKAASRKVTSP